MPERPDLDYVLPILDRELASRVITAVLVKKPVVLRLANEGPMFMFKGWLPAWTRLQPTTILM